MASRGHRAPRKAAYCPRKEVGQNIKVKNRAKWLGTEPHPGKEVLIEEVSKHQETLSLAVWGKFLHLRGQPNKEEKLIRLTDYMWKSNSQQNSTPDARIHHQ